MEALPEPRGARLLVPRTACGPAPRPHGAGGTGDVGRNSHGASAPRGSAALCRDRLDRTGPEHQGLRLHTCPCARRGPEGDQAGVPTPRERHIEQDSLTCPTFWTMARAGGGLRGLGMWAHGSPGTESHEPPPHPEGRYNRGEHRPETAGNRDSHPQTPTFIATVSTAPEAGHNPRVHQRRDRSTKRGPSAQRDIVGRIKGHGGSSKPHAE